jgi:radical SAM protein with 4Fe4S-binding SPASM domain
MIDHLYRFVCFLEKEGIDAVYLSFPWYISDDTAKMMDDYFERHLSWLGRSTDMAHTSWHSYTFKLDPEVSDKLGAELLRIDAETWRIKVRYNPALARTEMREFLNGSHRPAQNKTRCLALRSRMDVYPNGDAVSCHLFPELAIGNLIDAGVSDVWHGDAFNRVRKTLSSCGLMPICAKCNLLYTRGV